MTDQACPMSSSHDKKEKKTLHFERPKTQKEAYWEERCEKIHSLLVVFSTTTSDRRNFQSYLRRQNFQLHNS